MKELMDKLSSYNIFNYLLPGILFALAADSFTHYKLIQSDIITALFFYYFIGLVISRIGSVIIEPILIKLKFIEFSKYDQYVRASEKDELIRVLSESNNMYRTIFSMLLLMLILLLYHGIEINYPQVALPIRFILLVLLAILFLFSYRKQSTYIKKRVIIQNKEDD